ncbi:MAG: NifB/NifX family molybdenum-iron cluster-binding protein [Candidatus Aenigmarchaeota archaeon]|nr:NifB/NifX family molybdenum-iron cluster-binding protein [Candidatus Aenigmarchaeota archaeon]
MRIAVSSTGPDLDSQASPVFGRCPYFVIVDVEGNEIKGANGFPNQAMNMPGGAGIASAEFVANQGVQVVISGSVGPRSFDVLSHAGIKMYQSIPKTVRDNVMAFIEGKLKPITTPAGMGAGMGPGRGLGGGFGRGRGGGGW